MKNLLSRRTERMNLNLPVILLIDCRFHDSITTIIYRHQCTYVVIQYFRIFCSILTSLYKRMSKFKMVETKHSFVYLRHFDCMTLLINLLIH